MKFELQFNLGTDDAKYCNKECGASLSLDPKQLAAGNVVELPVNAVAYLTGTKGYTGLLKQAI